MGEKSSEMTQLFHGSCIINLYTYRSMNLAALWLVFREVFSDQ
jgi:hypothetical protein